MISEIIAVKVGEILKSGNTGVELRRAHLVGKRLSIAEVGEKLIYK